MKFCSKPFEQVHLDPGGGVRVCSWTDESIGNVLHEDLEVIWHGEKANKIRKSILDGSYLYCRAVSCPYLENDSLPDLDGKELEKAVKIGYAPSKYSVACDFTCNHSCPSCRDGIFCGTDDYRKNLKRELDLLLPYLNKASHIITCGNGDVFSSPLMMEMLEKLEPQKEDLKIQFETNGALFTRECWERIKHLGKYDLSFTVTPNSFEEHTFQYLNGGHDTLEKVIRNLYFIRELKRQRIVNILEISIVVQDRNFWELPDFARRCIEDFEADRVVVKPLYKWFCLSDDNYWHKDILNPQHPYHKEYLKMRQDPYLKNNDKIFFWGGNNLHTSQPHPAYRYKDYLRLLSEFADIADIEDKIREFFKNRQADTIYIYGDMELSSLIYLLLRPVVEVEAFIARDVSRTEICKRPVIRMCDYQSKCGDLLIVLNYQFYDNIMRDLHFRDFKGKAVSLLELKKALYKEVC